MPGAIEHLPTTESPLSRLDHRWKLAGLLLAAVAVLFLRTVPVASVALAAALLLAVLGRLPWRWCLARLGTVLLMLLPFLLLLPFLSRSEAPWGKLGPLSVYWGGVAAALVLGLKSLTLVLLMLVLLVTAPLPETFEAAQALRVPGLLVQLAVLTYRYVFVLAEELNRLRVALRVRGYRNRANLHCYRTVGHVAGALLVRGYERAERVGQAMQCRGFDGRFRSLAQHWTRAVDVGAFLLIVGTALALVLLDHASLPV